MAGNAGWQRATWVRRAKFIALFGLVVAEPIAGSAQIYGHSDRLQKSTDAAATAFPDQATALKPFDDQLANLAAFAPQEDLAVAQYWASVRDQQMTYAIGPPGPAEGTKLLSDDIERRLVTLVGAGNKIDETGWLTVPVLFNLRGNEVRAAARIADDLSDARADYQKTEPVGKSRDLTCSAVLGPQPDQPPGPPEPGKTAQDAIFAKLVTLCQQEQAASNPANATSVAAIDAQIIVIADGGAAGAPHGALATALLDLETAETATKPDLAPVNKQLAAEIAKAAALSKTGDASDLLAFRDAINSVLKTVSPATKVAGLDKVSTALDAILLSDTCDSTKVTDDAKKAAGCDKIEAQSTTAKVQAIWGFAQALAQLSDASDPNRRSAQWLAAAKAIVQADKDDAALAAAQKKVETEILRNQVRALAFEGADLVAARMAAAGKPTKCFTSAKVGAVDKQFACTLAPLVDAWNDGRIVAEVDTFRLIQIQREYTVRRARAAAAKQYALAQAGITSAKAYGAGGIKPATVAQILFDAAVLGLLGGK